MRVNTETIINMMCDKGVSQKQLAKGAGIAQNTVTSVLRRRKAKIQTLGKIAGYLECEPSKLIQA